MFRTVRTRNGRLRKTPYTSSKSHHARYLKKSIVTNRDTEISCKRDAKLAEHVESTKAASKCDKLLEVVKEEDVKTTEDDNQPSTSHPGVDQVTLSTGTFVNDGPAPSPVATVACKHHEVPHGTGTFQVSNLTLCTCNTLNQQFIINIAQVTKSHTPP